MFVQTTRVVQSVWKHCVSTAVPFSCAPYLCSLGEESVGSSSHKRGRVPPMFTFAAHVSCMFYAGRQSKRHVALCKATRKASGREYFRCCEVVLPMSINLGCACRLQTVADSFCFEWHGKPDSRAGMATRTPDLVFQMKSGVAANAAMDVPRQCWLESRQHGGSNHPWQERIYIYISMLVWDDESTHTPWWCDYDRRQMPDSYIT